jgi:histidine triad (HIT) family protein
VVAARHRRSGWQAGRVGNDCVFCRIVAGTAPASVAYRDETAVAFLDIRPMTPGHLLVVPRAHAAQLADLDPEIGGQLFRVGQRLAGALRRSGLRCEGVNLFLADGAAAGQEVFHVHLHVLPRYRGDGFRLRATFGTPSRDDLDRTAAAVRDGLTAEISDDPLAGRSLDPPPNA